MNNELKLNKEHDEFIPCWVVSMPNEKADKLLVEKISYDMEIQLFKKRKQGSYGWHTALSECKNEILLERLHSNLDRGDMLDVIILASMIYCRKKLWGDSA